MEIFIVVVCRPCILGAFNHNAFAINWPETMREIPFFFEPSAIFFHSSEDFGVLRYVGLSAVQIASQVSLTMLDTVVFPMRELKAWLCWASPSARYLKVTISLSWGMITSLERHGFFCYQWPNKPKEMLEPLRRHPCKSEKHRRGDN